VPLLVVSALGPTAIRDDGTGFVGVSELGRTLRALLD
jgi:hypothetical protein